MTRKMILTVGTSLFSSATWDPRLSADDSLPQEVPDYDRWLQDDWMKDPRRRACDTSVVGTLQQNLTEENGVEWGKLVPDHVKDSEARRFSSELTTLVQLAAEEARLRGEKVTLAGLLGLYEEILVVAEEKPQREEEQWVRTAAVHLRDYLNELAKNPVARLEEIDGISSSRPDRLKPGLERLRDVAHQILREDWRQELDLVLSGGYKVYSYLLSPLAYDRDGVRLLYSYEGADELMVLENGAIRIGSGDPVNISSDYGLPHG